MEYVNYIALGLFNRCFWAVAYRVRPRWEVRSSNG